jgi:hypothetical protein
MNTRMKKVAAGAVIVSLLVVGVVLLTMARGGLARGAYGMMRTSAASSCPATAGVQCSMNASQCAAATASGAAACAKTAGTCPAAGRQGTGARGACPMSAGTAVPACHAVQSGRVG